MPPKKAKAAATKSKTSSIASKPAAVKKSTSRKAEPITNGVAHTTTKKTTPTKTTKATKVAEKPHVNGVTTAAASKKRKASEEPPPASPTKKVKPIAHKTTAAKKPAESKRKVVINHAPTKKLDVYVFGQGENAELGLGQGSGVSEVKRPRLNPKLKADEVGVVELACGGMHTAALTYDNKIYTWGVNDQGALGRDTAWEGGLKDIDDNESDSSEDDPGNDLNPYEATPTAIPSSSFPEGTIFTHLAAGDSTTFALTDDGLVYGWGTFRGNEGIMGFTGESLVQKTPALISELKNIVKVVCGDNHVVALDTNGIVYAWGSGQQNQLGRRIVERTKSNGLVPRQFGLPKTVANIFAGNNHSFAITRSGLVFAWGLNSFGETGIPINAGEDEAAILHPVTIAALRDKKITCMAGGSHHSVAVTEGGECYVWGRLDGFQCGLKLDSLPQDNVIVDSRGHPRILIRPTQIPGIDAAYAAAGSDHCIVVTKDGKAYSWGFSAGYQTGLGTTDDVEVATHIDNTAVRGKKLVWAGAGGQFSVLAGEAAIGPSTNGINGVH